MANIIVNDPVPGIRIAKVGKDRKKKKSGGLFGFGGKAAGGRVLARAAAGAAASAAPSSVSAAGVGFLGTISSKIFMGLMLGIGGFGVYSAKQAFNNRAQIPIPAPQVFDRRVAPPAQKPQTQAAPSNLLTNDPGTSSLNMVSANLPEMTPPPQQQSAPAVAAPAPAPAQGPAIPDMSALTQAAQAAKGGAGGSPFDSKIGQLSGGMPALSGGGPGLSGGVGMPFKTLKPAAFVQKPKAMAMAQTAPSMGAGMARAGGGGGSGRAFGQLRTASGYSNAAAGTTKDNSAYLAGQPFDSGISNPNTIGSPQGIGAGSGLLGNADANPSSNPNSNGGQPSSGGGYGNSNYCPGCPPTNNGGTNTTPWNAQDKLASSLIPIALGLLALAAFIDLMIYEGWDWFAVPTLEAMVHGLCVAVDLIALTIVGLGMDVWANHGQTMHGLSFMAVGGAIMYGAHLVSVGATTAASTTSGTTTSILTQIENGFNSIFGLSAPTGASAAGAGAGSASNITTFGQIGNQSGVDLMCHM